MIKTQKFLMAAGSEKVVEWAIHMSSTLIFKAETAEINGAHSGGLPWKSRLGWKLTWCLMELWIRSIYQPDSLRDRPASISTAHNGLCWINNGWHVGVRECPCHWPHLKQDPLSAGWWIVFVGLMRPVFWRGWQLPLVHRADTRGMSVSSAAFNFLSNLEMTVMN